MHRRSLFAAVLLLASPAWAEQWVLPLGASVQPDAEHQLCPAGALATGWSLDSAGRTLRPPASADAGEARATLAQSLAANRCASGTTEPLTVFAVGRAPSLEQGSAALDLGARTLVLRGRGLRGSVLRWRAGNASGGDLCTEVSTAGGAESCTFALERSSARELTLEVWPPGTPTEGALVSFDAAGHRVPSLGQSVLPGRIVAPRLVAAGTSLDLSSGEARVSLEHPDAVASASCAEAQCSLEDGALVVRDARAVSDTLAVQLTLRPHYFVPREGGGTEAATTVRLPLQRCPVSLASAVPWRGVADPRVVVRVGGACAAGALEFTAGAGPLPVVASVTQDNQRYAVVQLERTPTEELTLRVRRAGTGNVLGVARGRPSPVQTGRTRLETEGLGAVDYLPNNRPARAMPPAVPGSMALVPVSVEGAYDVQQREGNTYVQGVEGVSGSVALRLALRDSSLPAPLDSADLGTWTEVVERPLRSASVPAPLTGERALVELVCGDGNGRSRPVTAGVVTSLPYRVRSTCALVFHRERLRREDGSQTLRLQVNVADLNGDEVVASRVDQRVVLSPGAEPRRVVLTGVNNAFDRASVRVSYVEEEGSPAEGGSSLQWSVQFGTERGRIYATAAIPTGLFRVADPGHTGILSLNAGALFRLAYLTREGGEFPLALEAGVLWVGIAGDTDMVGASRGQAALVTGATLSVPIANRGRAAQTSISLHVWFEYELSRALTQPTMMNPNVGSPVGFVFGPSLSIGDLGASF